MNTPQRVRLALARDPWFRSSLTDHNLGTGQCIDRARASEANIMMNFIQLRFPGHIWRLKPGRQSRDFATHQLSGRPALSSPEDGLGLNQL
jgi:hypothetical protein